MVRAEKSISDKNESFVGMIKDLLGGFSVIKSFQAEKQRKRLSASRVIFLRMKERMKEYVKKAAWRGRLRFILL